MIEIALHNGTPNTILAALHLHDLLLSKGGGGVGMDVVLHIHTLGITGSKEFERRCLRSVCHLVEAEVLSLSVKCCQSQ